MSDYNPFITFEPFLDRLKEEGFVLGIDTYQNIHKILNKMGPDVEVTKLKFILAPLLAHNQQEQELFYELFEDFFHLDKKLPVHPEHRSASDLTAPETTKPNLFKLHWKKIATYSIGIFVFVFVISYVYRNRVCLFDPESKCKTACNPGPDLDEDGTRDDCDEAPNNFTRRNTKDSKNPDNDDIPLKLDNCPYVYNPDQKDSDEDGQGDACDPCPFVAFQDQNDRDCDNLIGENDPCPDDSTNACIPGDNDGDGVPNALDNCPNDNNPDQLDSDFDQIGDACDDQNGLEQVASLPPIAPDLDHLIRPCNLSFDEFIPVLILLLPMALIVLIVIIYNIYYRRRKFLATHRKESSTSPSRLILEFGNLPDIKPVKRSSQLLRDLRERIKSRAVHLDLPKSIEATIENAGFPSFQYTKSKEQPQYLIFIERKSLTDQLTRFLEFRMLDLQVQGVHLQQYYFETDPRICYSAKTNLRTSLFDLQRQFPTHRVIFIGECHGWMNPFTYRFEKWVERFTYGWKEKAILSTVPPQNWKHEELVLAGQFPVIPLGDRLQGLRIAVQIFEEEQYKGAFRNTVPESLIQSGPDLDSEIMEPEEIISELRQHLTRTGFDWLCACAVYPELSWDLTLYLGHHLSDENAQIITDYNLHQLVLLPWFRTGKIPDSLRIKLIACLDETTNKKVRKILMDLLQKQTPVPGSRAEEFHKMQLALQHLSVFEHNKKERTLALRTITELPDHIRKRDQHISHTLQQDKLKNRGTFPSAWYHNGLPALGLRPARFNLLMIPVFLVALVFFTIFFPVLSPPMIMKAKNGQCYGIRYNQRANFFALNSALEFKAGVYDSAFYYATKALLEETDVENDDPKQETRTIDNLDHTPKLDTFLFNYATTAKMLSENEINGIFDRLDLSSGLRLFFNPEGDENTYAPTTKQKSGKTDYAEKIYQTLDLPHATFNLAALNFNNGAFHSAFTGFNDAFESFDSNDSTLTTLRGNCLYNAALSISKTFLDFNNPEDNLDNEGILEAKEQFLNSLIELNTVDSTFFCKIENAPKRSIVQSILKGYFKTYGVTNEIETVSNTLKCAAVTTIKVNLISSRTLPLDTQRIAAVWMKGIPSRLNWIQPEENELREKLIASDCPAGMVMILTSDQPSGNYKDAVNALEQSLINQGGYSVARGTMNNGPVNTIEVLFGVGTEAKTVSGQSTSDLSGQNMDPESGNHRYTIKIHIKSGHLLQRKTFLKQSLSNHFNVKFSEEIPEGVQYLFDNTRVNVVDAGALPEQNLTNQQRRLLIPSAFQESYALYANVAYEVPENEYWIFLRDNKEGIEALFEELEEDIDRYPGFQTSTGNSIGDQFLRKMQDLSVNPDKVQKNDRLAYYRSIGFGMNNQPEQCVASFYAISNRTPFDITKKPGFLYFFGMANYQLYEKTGQIDLYMKYEKSIRDLYKADDMTNGYRDLAELFVKSVEPAPLDQDPNGIINSWIKTGYSRTHFGNKGIKVDCNNSEGSDNSPATPVRFTFTTLNREYPSNPKSFVPRKNQPIAFLDESDRGTYLYEFMYQTSGSAGKNFFKPAHFYSLQQTLLNQNRRIELNREEEKYDKAIGLFLKHREQIGVAKSAPGIALSLGTNANPGNTVLNGKSITLAPGKWEAVELEDKKYLVKLISTNQNKIVLEIWYSGGFPGQQISN